MGYIDFESNYDVLKEKIYGLTDKCIAAAQIRPELYTERNVKRGLRDINGQGVLAGLTEISEIRASKIVDGVTVPCEGELYYRGYNIYDIVRDISSSGRFGFEEVVYLLLFGCLPNAEELASFRSILSSLRTLPTNFVRDVVLKAPSSDMMNTLARGVLTLYAYDENPTDLSVQNVLRQSIQLISVFPLLAVYAYQAYDHYIRHNSLMIHKPEENLSTAENILYMLRHDKSYTALEAKILDLALILHAEHGGGNNSTFTTHVVTSSGTDTYSAIAAALCSLKGIRHGGANNKVVAMIENIKENVSNWNDKGAVADYLGKILDKEAFDRSGLIYGIGHAVYSLSDPRANVFKAYVEALSEEKGRHNEYLLYKNVAEAAVDVIGEKRRIYKGVAPNIDFYSGFVYTMLELPPELFTPLFAVSRVAGWSAHRLEEIINNGKIIRPAYGSVCEQKNYIPLAERE